MRLSCYDIVMGIIKTDGSSIVPQYRYHPGFLSFERQGWGFNAGFEQVVNSNFVSGVKVMIAKNASESIVIAMVASGLGKIFQLNVGWI